MINIWMFRKYKREKVEEAKFFFKKYFIIEKYKYKIVE